MYVHAPNFPRKVQEGLSLAIPHSRPRLPKHGAHLIVGGREDLLDLALGIGTNEDCTRRGGVREFGKGSARQALRFFVEGQSAGSELIVANAPSSKLALAPPSIWICGACWSEFGMSV